METTKNIECKIHGMSEYTLEGRGYYRCKQCRSDAVKKRRRNLKIKAVTYKGGKCFKCGYNKCYAALQFHHINPQEKDFGISHKGHTKSWDKIKSELDKCILLCSNCHSEAHQDSLIQK